MENEFSEQTIGYQTIGYQTDEHTGTMKSNTQEFIDQKIEYHLREVLKLLSITNEEVIRETPRRFREVLQDRTSSNRIPLDRQILKTFEVSNPGMVIIKDIEVLTFCEHHILPFSGTVSIAYIPKNQVLGLSKLVRIVDYCSRKENLQERLTKEILSTLNSTVDNEGICIIMKCKHFCMIMNSEIRSKSDTITIEKSGKFKEDPEVFREFQNALKQNDEIRIISYMPKWNFK